MLYFIYIWHARTYAHVYITIYISSKCRFVSPKLVFSLYVYNFIWAYVQLYLSFKSLQRLNYQHWIAILECQVQPTQNKGRENIFHWCHIIPFQVSNFKINQRYPYQIYFTLNAWSWETNLDISININFGIRYVIYQSKVKLHQILE